MESIDQRSTAQNVEEIEIIERNDKSDGIKSFCPFSKEF